jgi:hypothetical protein
MSYMNSWEQLYREAEERIWRIKHILFWSVAINVTLLWTAGCLWYFNFI